MRTHGARLGRTVMRLGLSLCGALSLAMGTALGLGAQSVVVDQGTFSLSMGGEVIGSEEFSIRRAGFGRSAAYIASGTVALSLDGESQELRPLLSAHAPEGAADGYQLKVSGIDASEAVLNLVGPRFVASFRSAAGEEEREFSASTHTRIVERLVAHHYYFLGNVSEGARVPVIEPHSRLVMDLVAGAWVDEELRLGPNRVDARKVVFRDGEQERIVWFDRQGRVLRVEIPTLQYVAERQDLVG